jgi:hypothetical protein
LVCANDGAIDDRAGLIDLDLQLPEDRCPVSLPRPVRESVVDRLPRTEPLGQIAPRQASLGAKKNGLDEDAIASRRLRPSLLLRQDSLQATPLLVGERVPMHHDF